MAGRGSTTLDAGSINLVNIPGDSGQVVLDQRTRFGRAVEKTNNMPAINKAKAQGPGTLRHDPKVEIAYVALADHEVGGVARSVLVVAPGLLEARGIPPEREAAAQLRVDLDRNARLYGVEILWSSAQLPRTRSADPKGEDMVLDVRLSDGRGAIRFLLGAEDDVTATVPVEHVAGPEPPRLLFDPEGRLVALDVVAPSEQLRPEMVAALDLGAGG